jgi:hypothetical protein
VPFQPQRAPEAELAVVVRTASASSLQDSSATEMLQEITFHHRRDRIAPAVMVVAALAVGIGMMAELPLWALIPLVIFGAVAHAIATSADYKRKIVHLDYALEADAARAYAAFLQGIEQLRALGGLWLVSSGEANASTKYNAGAQYSIKRNRINMKFEPPRFISTDAAVYVVNTGPQQLYFLPDRILVYEGDQIGAVPYSSLTLTVGGVYLRREREGCHSIRRSSGEHGATRTREEGRIAASPIILRFPWCATPR